jgi:oligopeptide/dipeptide ABC transporter ATP-binding protein
MKGGSRSDIEKEVDEVLTLVGLGPAYKSRLPRELSGGQQQRIAMARALMSDPELVVLDEPTSSLDQSVRGRMISLLREIQNERNVAYLFISHDLSTVRRIADRVAVMYLGRVVEVAETERVFKSPQHPYTKALLSAVPSFDQNQRSRRIILKGETPNPADAPTGCAFQDRCSLVHAQCREEMPELKTFVSGHDVECFAVPTLAVSG